MISTLFLAIATLGQVDGPSIDAAQFQRLIQGLHSEIRDVSFLYEAGSRYIGPRHLLKTDPALGEENYQGTYAYRSDGATLLDNYYRINAVKDSFKHNTYFLLGNTYQFVERQPDQARARVMKYDRVPGALNNPCSPERFLYLSYLRAVDPAALNYQFQGWEDVDGHRCLRIEMDYVPNLKADHPNRPTYRYWIDMARGGHPLRVDSLRGGKLLGRVEKIRLAQFPTEDGKKVWLPVSGEDLSYAGEVGEYRDSPTFRETFSLVDGTVQVNRGLPDSQFSLDWKGGMPESEGLKKLRDEFGPMPLYRTDSASVQQHLDKKLAQADIQAARLDASSASQSSWSTTTMLQAGLALFGVVVIIASLLLKRRGG